MIRRSLLLSIAVMMAFTLKIQFSEVRAAENTESIAGFYIGWASGCVLHGCRFWLYLLPDGTFYDGFVAQGYDEFNLARHLRTQHPLRAAADSGRYVVRGTKVAFRCANGNE